MQELRCFTGLDWGRQHHQVCVMDRNGQVLGNKRFPHSGAGLRQMAEWILERTEVDVRHIGAVVETSNGPVVDTLQQHGLEVFSINPKQLDRYRDCFSMARAKDDRFDARVLAETVRRDRDLLRPVERMPSEILALREGVRQRSQLVEDKVRPTYYTHLCLNEAADRSCLPRSVQSIVHRCWCRLTNRHTLSTAAWPGRRSIAIMHIPAHDSHDGQRTTQLFGLDCQLSLTGEVLDHPQLYI